MRNILILSFSTSWKRAGVMATERALFSVLQEVNSVSGNPGHMTTYVTLCLTDSNLQLGAVLF